MRAPSALSERHVLALGVLCLCLVAASYTACGDDSRLGGEDPTGVDGADGVTYHNTIRPLIEANCLGCHNEGGIGPFTLTSYDEVYDVGPGLISEVQARIMPPWPADPECAPTRDSRRLSDDQVAAFVAWGEAGRPEGDPADYAAPEVPERSTQVLGEPDLRIALEPYTPRRDRPDDYRCLPLPHEFTEDTFIMASDVIPDQRDVVHHVIAYMVPEDDVPAMEALDEREEGPGYTCFGGPRVGSNEMAAGWAPGSQPQAWPEGSAVLIPAGMRLVMQMHYNVAAVPEGEPVPEDRSEMALWILPPGEVPDRLVYNTLFANFGIAIEAGDPRSVHEMTFSIPFGAELIGVVPHMHTLGTTITVDLDRADGSGNVCLVDVPYWDFNWQQFYFFPDDAHMQLYPGDALNLRCEYDNRPSNQPVINGERVEPRDVYFGDSTFDEMCLAFLITTQPFVPGETGLCGGLDRCIEDCPESDSQCGLGCTFNGGQDCALCTVNSFADCAQEHCPSALGPLFSCFGGCEDYFGCFSSECAVEYDQLYDCLEPHMLAGECNEPLAACDVAF